MKFFALACGAVPLLPARDDARPVTLRRQCAARRGLSGLLLIDVRVLLALAVANGRVLVSFDRAMPRSAVPTASEDTRRVIAVSFWIIPYKTEIDFYFAKVYAAGAIDAPGLMLNVRCGATRPTEHYHSCRQSTLLEQSISQMIRKPYHKAMGKMT